MIFRLLWAKKNPTPSTFSGIATLAPISSSRVTLSFSLRLLTRRKSSCLRIPIDKPKGIDDCKEEFGIGFEVFFADLIRTAIELPKKITAPEIAFMLLEREKARLKGLQGIDRERHFERIVKLCAASQIYGKSQATARLCKLGREIIGVGATEFKEAIQESLKPRNKSDRKFDLEEAAARELESQALNIAESLNAFYDEQRKEYALAIGPDVYQTRTEAQFKRDLRFCGLSTAIIERRNWSKP